MTQFVSANGDVVTDPVDKDIVIRDVVKDVVV